MCYAPCPVPYRYYFYLKQKQKHTHRLFEVDSISISILPTREWKPRIGKYSPKLTYHMVTGFKANIMPNT